MSSIEEINQRFSDLKDLVDNIPDGELEAWAKGRFNQQSKFIDRFYKKGWMLHKHLYDKVQKYISLIF